MQLWSFWDYAPKGTVYSQDAFDRLLGTNIIVTAKSTNVVGVLVSADVSEDGASVWLTVETPPGAISFIDTMGF